MDLFHSNQDEQNLLPEDGTVIYFPNFLNAPASRSLFNHLLDGIAWQNEVIKIYGKTHIPKRQVAWFGNFDYGYTGNIHKAQPLPHELDAVHHKIQGLTGHSFNGCLLNLYHNGDESMGWHADNEKELGVQPIIASVSLGSNRKFKFKHRVHKTVVDLILEDGSLLIMKGKTQENWLHCLPIAKKVKTPRINLTFRTIKK